MPDTEEEKKSNYFLIAKEHIKELASIISDKSIITKDSFTYKDAMEALRDWNGPETDEVGLLDLINGTIKNINNDDIINIRDYTFVNCGNLESISAITRAPYTEDDPRRIGSYAFSGCASLTTAIFPEATEIGDYAFKDCLNLKSLSLPKISSVNNFILQDCTALTDLTWGETLAGTTMSVGDLRINKMSNLVNISLPNVTSISGSTTAASTKCCFLSLSNLETATFGNLNSFGNGYAFKDCTSLTKVDGITNNLTTIAVGTFQNCNALTTIGDKENIISIPNITAIKASAFQNCSAITTIYAPNTTDVAANTAFSGCTDLKDITLGTTTISAGYIPLNNLTSISFPNATIVAPKAFSQTDKLTFISLPKVYSIGANAFYYDHNLGPLELPQQTNTVTIGENAFNDCNNLSKINIFAQGATIETNAFAKINNLTSLYIASQVLPEDITYAGASVITIKQSAFLEGAALSDVKIGNEKTTTITIGENAFQNCNWLSETLYPTYSIRASTINISANAFNGNTLSEINTDNFAGSLSLAANAFNGANIISFKGSLTGITANAFAGATELEELTITLPDAQYTTSGLLNDIGSSDKSLIITINGAITTSGNSCVFGNTNATAMSLPNYIQANYRQAFANNKRLVSFSAPNLISVGRSMFEGCSSLKGLNLPKVSGIYNLSSAGCPFSGCTSLTDLTLGGSSENTTHIPTISAHLSGLTALKNATLYADTITSAFSAGYICSKDDEGNYISKLETVNLPVTTTLSGTAFDNITSLKEIKIPAVKTLTGPVFQNAAFAEPFILDLTTVNKINITSANGITTTFNNFSNVALKFDSTPPTISIGSSKATLENLFSETFFDKMSYPSNAQTIYLPEDYPTGTWPSNRFSISTY